VHEICSGLNAVLRADRQARGDDVTAIQHAVTGVILAGGKSSRMGQNKALMRLGGTRLVDRAVTVMHEVFSDLLMVTNTPEMYTGLGIPMVRDVWPDKGSLGGIYSAIYHVTTPYCLVVACDMPFLHAGVLRYLVTQIADYDVVIPDVLDELQTLHAIYSKTCLPPIERCLEANRLRIVGFLPEVRVRRVTASEIQPCDPELLAFQNLNTPEDFQAAEQRLRA
jgi:molybdopterin-guanine dinucleotide biosynthesis protein A